MDHRWCFQFTSHSNLRATQYLLNRLAIEFRNRRMLFQGGTPIFTTTLWSLGRPPYRSTSQQRNKHPCLPHHIHVHS